MSWKSLGRAALGLLLAILIGIAVPVPVAAWSGEIATGGFFAQVWEWLEDLWPDPIRPSCTGDGCSDAGHGADPNG